MPFGDSSRSRRTPLVWAGMLTGTLVVSAAFQVAPLRDAETWRAVVDARLQLSSTFLAFAPLNNILDALTLLSVREHVALLLALASGYVLLRAMLRARRSRDAGRPSPRSGRGPAHPVSFGRELAIAASALACLVIVYAVDALAPRPMAALVLSPPDSDLVVVDFHSHTEASHDGRPGFTAERNRAWHAAAGFHAAYISDHFTFAGAEAGTRGNPTRAGEGTTLLSAIECLEGGEHVNVLGVTAADSALFRGHYIVASAVAAWTASGRPIPVLVQTIPGSLNQILRAGTPDVVPVSAIELSDGAPRGLGAADQDRPRIIHIADSLGLAFVAGSDNHGWGRTAAAWSVIRIPGWRAMTPAELGRRIEDEIRARGRRAGRVIERTRPVWRGPERADPGASSVAARPAPGWRIRAKEIAGAGVFLGQFCWQLAGTRSWAERVSWVVWIWAVAGLVWWRRGR